MTDKPIPRFTILPDQSYCSPLILTFEMADGTFTTLCRPIPRLVVGGKTQQEAETNMKLIYHAFCQLRIWN